MVKENMPFLISFVALIYIGFAIFNGFNWRFIKFIGMRQDDLKFKTSTIYFIFYVSVLFSINLIPNMTKYRLIYMRWECPLPGCHAFTKILNDEIRISRDELVFQYGALPESPKKQNELWYKIYKEKKKQGNHKIIELNNSWLLFSDLFVISIIVFIPSTIFTFWNTGFKKGLFFITIYIALIAVIRQCAYNKGIELVATVIRQ